MADDTMTCLLDGNRGVYIPQAFVECFIPDVWNITNEDDIAILREGPEHEWYWEVWDSVLNEAVHTDMHGKDWTLYQDGDLFAVRSDHKWEEDDDAGY